MSFYAVYPPPGGGTLAPGSATAANQVLEIADLDAIKANQTNGTQVTQISGTVPLPTGSATAANQVLEIAQLTAINSNTTGVSTAANQASVIGTKAAGTAATNSMLVGGVYNSSAPTLTNGQQASAQLDAFGNLMVNAVTTSLPTDVTASATLGSANAAVTLTCNGISSVGFYIASGLSGGSLAFEATYDGTNWISINGLLTSLTYSGTFTPTGGGSAILNGAPYRAVRVRVSAYGSGSATGLLIGSSGLGPNQVFTANASSCSVTSFQGGSWDVRNVTGTVVLPTGASTSALQTSGNTSLTALAARTAGSLTPVAYDEVDLTYVPSGNGTGQIATAVYKLATVTQATLTMTYDASNRLSTVVKS